MLDHPLVEFVGEIGDDEKQGALGDALAVLFPIDWPEPFGLIMIEAMACGTPVIAFRRGSVPEILEDGADRLHRRQMSSEAVAAVSRLAKLDRAAIRRRFEERFTAERMARDYVQLYRQLCGSRGERSSALSWRGPPSGEATRLQPVHAAQTTDDLRPFTASELARAPSEPSTSRQADLD